MFNEYSNSGIISNKEFTDCFMKLVVLSVSFSHLLSDVINIKFFSLKEKGIFLSFCHY